YKAGNNYRDYNLTANQQAIKAKYPPLTKKYECNNRRNSPSKMFLVSKQMLKIFSWRIYFFHLLLYFFSVCFVFA
uniref:Uncharacterized protein n=1 Tax=Gopherus agassizii TaxID=38772 RepID=A0A452GNF5_9SAUR